MEELLKKLYYDPATGFTSIKRLYERAKQQDPKITLKFVKEWLQSQEVQQIYSKDNKNAKQQYIPIKCGLNSVGCLQADLLDISRYKNYNKKITFILVVIDVQTRYAWCYALKNKMPKTIEPCFENVINFIQTNYPDNPITITTDYGNEFKGAVSKYFKEKDILHIQTLSKTANSIVERFNKNIWNFIKKYTQSTGKLQFIDKLDDFIQNYNTSHHKTLQEKPENAYNDIRLARNHLKRPYNPLPPLQIGDKVRYANAADDAFEKKSFKMQYSQSVYYIVGREYNRYLLSKEPQGEPIEKQFLRRQLKLIDKVEKPARTSNVKKALKQIRKQRNIKLLENEIIPQSDKQKQAIKPYRSKRLVSKPARL